LASFDIDSDSQSQVFAETKVCCPTGAACDITKTVNRSFYLLIVSATPALRGALLVLCGALLVLCGALLVCAVTVRR
jgi:hypothetical protein